MYVDFKPNSQIISSDPHRTPILVSTSGVILNKRCYY